MGTMHWVIFCQVIDNWGDIGVCWRLARQLSARGARVTLYSDDLSPLAWMRDPVLDSPRITPLPWAQAAQDFAQADFTCDVVIEAFGCHLPHAVEQRLWHEPWVWINLEYLSAETWVERCHLLPSPQGDTAKPKWFFYPGFSPKTGGLLRDDQTKAKQHVGKHGSDDLGTKRNAMLTLWQTLELDPALAPQPQEQLVVLFCYDTAPWGQLAHALGSEPLLILHLGQAAGAKSPKLPPSLPTSPPFGLGLALGRQQRYLTLPAMPQTQFDQLLRCSDFNIVRGEDSWVQALWACRLGTPCVWHIYAQDDDVHHAKLQACLETLQADSTQTHWHHYMNGLRSDPPRDWPRPFDIGPLLAQSDLCSQLWSFAHHQTLIATSQP